MEIRVLGAVRVLDRDRVLLRARRRERLLLGLLALHPGQVLTVARLTTLLWDDKPKRPRETLQVYVSRLRAQLSGVDGRPGLDIVNQADGYLLRIEPGNVDAHRFLAECAAARDLADPAERAARLRAALDLWQGPLLADAADDPLRARLDGPWESARLSAVEQRVEADLDAGRHEALVPELSELVAAHGDRERLIAAYMKALYRSGRAADALRAYRDAATGLADRLGIDFSDDLNDLYVSMLRRDPALDPPRRGPAQAQLPPTLSSFLGRDAELTRLTALPDVDGGAGRPVACVIDGMPGVGKTALAVHAGHRIAAKFPDGQIYLDLHGFTAGSAPVEPAQVLDRMLRALSVPPEAIPSHVDDRAAMWRSRVADRRMLIILDNAVDEAQVRPLLPAAAECLVLVTSRRRLSGLDDVEHLSLAPLPDADASRLFARLTGTGDDDPAPAGEIARLCGGLPLAVRIAAGRLNEQPYWTVDRLASRLRDGDRRLAELDGGSRGVAAALDVSYRHLAAPAQRAFRLLAVAPLHTFDSDDAAALLDTDTATADRLLVDLAAARLVQPCGPDQYRFHDLVAEYAARVVAADETDSNRRAARHRLLDHYRVATNYATYRIDPGRTRLYDDRDRDPLPRVTDRATAAAWYDDHRYSISAMIRTAAVQGFPEYAWKLAAAAAMYYELRKHYDDWNTTHQIGLEAARAVGDTTAESGMLYRLVAVRGRDGDIEGAVHYGEQARELAERLGDTLGLATVLNNLGSMYSVGFPDDPDSALRSSESYLYRALTLYRECADRIGEAKAQANLGDVYRRYNLPSKALSCLDAAERLFSELDRPSGRAFALRAAASVHAQLDEFEPAVAKWTAALELARRHGSPEAELESLAGLGTLYRRSGDLEAAVKWHGQLRDCLPDGYPDAEAAGFHQAIGDTFAAARDPDAALRHYRLARRCAERAKDTAAVDLADAAIGSTAVVDDAAGTDESVTDAGSPR